MVNSTNTTSTNMTGHDNPGGLSGWLQPQKNRMFVLMTLAAIAMLIPLVSSNYGLEIMTNVWFSSLARSRMTVCSRPLVSGSRFPEGSSAL